MNDYYTLIWKDFNNNKVVKFKSFTSFDQLKYYLEHYIKGGRMKNTRAIDEDKTIYYCEVLEDDSE